MNRIKINQVYVAPFSGGKGVLRRIRILAPDPDGGYIINVLWPVLENGKLQRITNIGLERAYTLEVDVCEHRHTEDVYIDGGSNYPPSVPNYYQCTDCGDLFPNIGDTNLWFPKQLEKVKV